MSLFVTFEGPDGAGKSTQVRRVADRLERSGWSVVATREPGGTGLGERIREVLLGSSDDAIVPRAEALLMTAARSQHVHDVIRPALARGEIILCDRFADSTLAYQGAGRGLPVAELEQLQAFAIGSLRPDLTILLDLPAKEGLARRARSDAPLNRLDRDQLAFHERVRTWYVQAAELEPDRWVRLDATMDPEALAEAISDFVIERVSREAHVNEAGE